jgi:hypothetical protein
MPKKKAVRRGKKYVGFKKLVKKIKKKGKSTKSAKAIAAAIGRKKYGKTRFKKMAQAGRKRKR